MKEQLDEPTDIDVDMFKTLERMQGIMADSITRVIKNRIYYETLLAIPKVKEVMNNPKVSKKGVYAPGIIKSMQMMAPTFEVVLVTGPGEPLPAITKKGARELWTKDLKDGEARDAWEQIQWNIRNNSTVNGIQRIEDNLKHIGDGEQQILARDRDQRNKSKGKPPQKKPVKSSEDSNEKKNNKRRDTDDENKGLNDRPSPTKASRTKKVRSVNQLASINPGLTQQSKKTIELFSSDDEEKPANKIIELSSDEEEVLNPNVITMPTLYNMNKDVYKAIETKGALLPSRCVQAITETIHRETNRTEISCVNTDLFPHLIKGKQRAAKSLLHPDNRYKRHPGTEWITPDKQIATAKSKILLIPCHITKENRQKQIIMSHWVLAARIRTTESQCKLLVFDSCGVKWARKQTRTIRKHLIKIKLLEENDAWEALSLKEQTEQECGIRMVVYAKIHGLGSNAGTTS
jgi:hypothetical protein